MTKSELFAKTNLTTKEVADLFRITSGAVSQWPDDEQLPELRLLQLQKLRPELFRAPRYTPVEQVA